MYRVVFAVMLAASLSGCSSLSQTFSTHPTSQLTMPDTQAREQVFVASTRAVDGDGEFGEERSETLLFANTTVTYPASHRTGAISAGLFNLGAGPAVVQSEPVPDMAAFARGVINHARETSRSTEVTVFVHGYNSNYEKSLFRTAQMGLDLDLPAASVLYAWPSANRILSYIHDIDSTAFARDGLVELLKSLSARGASRITVIGHSMGAQLAMEAVRQLAITRDTATLSHLAGVALLSPDTDLDLFNHQMRSIERTNVPVVAYISHEDAALQLLSDAFGEGKLRLGAVDTTEALDGHRVIVIDVAHMNDTYQSSHLAVATSPTLIRMINAMERPDLIRFAQDLAEGAYPGQQVTRYGQTVRVELGEF